MRALLAWTRASVSTPYNGSFPGVFGSATLSARSRAACGEGFADRPEGSREQSPTAYQHHENGRRKPAISFPAVDAPTSAYRFSRFAKYALTSATL